ncbi:MULTISPECIES: GPW/gp25 family protein, partial [unclassified Bartonella]
MNSGMDRTTGKPLTGIDHLRQSILDILSTRIGSRVMRRDYGSRVAELIDAPVNNAFAVA